MKAYLVREKNQFCATVVFAEKPSKARMLALSTDCCENACYIDIEVRRQPQIDKYYKEGKWHLDWDDPQDRIILVKECGFMCDEEVFELEYCELCSAKKYCEEYQEKKKEEKEHENDYVKKYKSAYAKEMLPILLRIAKQS